MEFGANRLEVKRNYRLRYDVAKLLSTQFGTLFPDGTSKTKIFCDIDKTYLDTEFESIVQLAKIALIEEAKDKKTVAGAQDVLYALRWGFVGCDDPNPSYPRSLHFVSSSPPQLRDVLEEKIFMDGLDWSSTTFKDQTYNIRHRRFDLIKRQIAYKTAAILRMIQSDHDAQYLMLGDSAETDSYIYLGIKLFLEGALQPADFAQYLSQAGIEDEVVESIIARYPVKSSNRVLGIFIRLLPTYPFRLIEGYTDCITRYDNFFEVACYCAALDLLEPGSLRHLALRFHNDHEFSLDQVLETLHLFRLRFQLSAPVRSEVEEILEHLTPYLEEFVLDDRARSHFKPSVPLASHSASEYLSRAKSWLDS